MDELTQRFQVNPRRVSETESYEYHEFAVLGRHGAVVFLASPCMKSQLDLYRRFPDMNPTYDGWPWMGWGVDYHAPRPHYPSQPVAQESCQFLDGVACYSDGTSLGGSELLKAWFDSQLDDNVIWDSLRQYYASWLATDETVYASGVTALLDALSNGEEE